MFKRVTSLVLSAAIFVGSGVLSPELDIWSGSAVSITAKADDTVIYNGDTMSEFSKRTAEDVAKKYTEAYYAGANYVDADPSTYYATPASIISPYNQGVLAADTLKCMQEMTSFYRWLVGNKPLAVTCEPTPSLQYQALDRNFEFNHEIQNSSKPANMSQELWNKGFKCEHNVLAVGFTPLGAITGWMNEGYHIDKANSSGTGWTSLGHRQIILHPDHIEQQFGYCGNVAIGSCDFNTKVTSYQPFYAFPSPGYVPNVCVFPEETAWSFGLDLKQVKIKSADSLKVTVTNLSTGKSYECTKANGKLHIENDDFIGFVQPTDHNTTTNRYDSNYKVVITGLTDVKTSKSAQIQYTVKFFDVKDYSASTIKKAGLNYNNVKIYADTFEGTDNLKKLGACLPQIITITNEFGNSAKVKTSGAWKLDEVNSCWYNSVDPSDVPVKFVDTGKLLDRITISYEYVNDSYLDYNKLTVSPNKPNEGANVRFTVERPYVDNDATMLCQIVTDDNGNYYCKKSYSSLSSPEFDKTGSTNYYHYFNIEATPEDSGSYISLYYSTGGYWTDAYVCTNARTLSVSHEYELISTKEVTCSTNGEKVYKCKNCGDIYTETTPMTGHTYTGMPFAATCTDQGYTLYTCSTCGDTFMGNYTPAKGHDFGSWSVTTPMTCTTNGVQTRVCSVCNMMETKTLTAPGHSTGSWTITKQSTCSSEGSEQSTCSVCKQTVTRAIPKIAHSLTFTRTVAPTCTDQGYSLYTCSVCKATERKNIVDAKGHSWSGWTTTQQATCSKQGVQVRTCSTCGASENQATDKTPHNYTSKVVAPTCTEKGYTLYTCRDCAHSEMSDYVTQTGHKWGDWSMTQQPSCAKEGINTRTCSQCGSSETIPIAKMSHQYTSKTVAASVTANGYTEHTCSVCGYSYKDNEKAKISLRIAGDNRYLTAMQIADQLKKENGGKAFDNIIIASGANAADALSATYLAKVKNAPILVVANAQVRMNEVADYVKKNAAVGANIYIIGGEGAVSTQMETKLSGFKVKRLAGKNRYLTNIAVLKEAKVTDEELLVANAINPADALSASAVGKPILLVSGSKLLAEQADYLATLSGNKITVIGGTGAVSEGIESQLKSIKNKSEKSKEFLRLGGADRYATSVLVANEYFKNPPTVVLAYALDYPDGLCGGPLALQYQCPLILTASKKTDEAQKYAKSIGATNAVTLGGESLISDAALKTILGK